jgi:hypothetical protein
VGAQQGTRHAAVPEFGKGQSVPCALTSGSEPEVSPEHVGPRARTTPNDCGTQTALRPEVIITFAAVEDQVAFDMLSRILAKIL